MRKREADYFRVRRPTLKHTAKIPDSRSRDQREYDLVIERVFERKHAVYRAPADDNAKDTYAARYFYENLYVRSELKSGWSGGATATPKDFIEDVILREGDIGRNRVSYLIGDVGVGKTVFANWLISTQLRKHVEEGKIWFLRMDLEDLKSGEPVSHRELIYHLIHYLCDEVVPHNQPVFSGFEKEIEKLKTTLSDAHEDHFNRMFLDRTKALCELANKIQKASSRRFVLILDNIDYICHIHDRGLYDDLQDTGEIPVLLKICESILQFNRKRELGHLGANVVIVTRPDSHDTMERAMVASYESPSATDGAVYWLKAAKLKDVVQNHCALLKEVTRDEPEGRRNRYLKIPKIIERDLETGSPMLVDHLLSITNLGLRQVMGFFAQYGWVSGGYDEGGPRLLGSYPIGLLTFMLNGKARFSEEDSRFPNVYL
ncbi:MAG: ATP-binding protein, partial [Candidatus Zixiibacteriota bacterium]